MRKKKSLIILGILLNFLTSCASVPDEPVCFEIHPAKGYCVNTISAKEFPVDEENKYKGKTWWEMKPYMIYLPVSSWVEFKSYIIKRCKQHNCSKQIAKWKRTIEIIDERSKK